MRNKQALTTGDVAKYCGVSFRTVIRWIEGGRLNAYRLPGRGDNRIHVEEFLQFLTEHDMPIPEELTDSQRRVLVIEADLQASDNVTNLLNNVGFEVQTAQNGFDAGCCIETFSPAVVVLDMNVPGLAGDELVEYIRTRQDPQHIRILLIGQNSREDLERSVQTGADDYLQKPFTDGMLIEKVAELANAGNLLANSPYAAQSSAQ